MTKLANEFKKALLALDKLAARDILIEFNRSKGSVQSIEKVVIPAMEQIGLGWEEGKLALSQVYMSGRICEDLVDTILPPTDPARQDQPKMAIAVFNDYHLLGKRIVYATLRASGHELQDYGTVRDADALVSRVKNDGIEILLLSVLMLHSALKIRDLTKKLKEAELEVKVVVGGAPFRFDDRLWQEVGADAMGKNASEALEIITKMVEVQE